MSKNDNEYYRSTNRLSLIIPAIHGPSHRDVNTVDWVQYKNYFSIQNYHGCNV